RRRPARAGAHRAARRPRPGQAGVEAGRGGCRRARLLAVAGRRGRRARRGGRRHMTRSEAAVDASIAPDGLLARIRERCAEVADRARHVHIDLGALGRLAGTLASEDPPLLPEERPAGTEEEVVASIVAWNAVNFGSGWFPHLRKRPGLSGARSLAAAFAEHVEEAGAPTASWLAEMDAATCAAVFDQPHPGPVDDL